jgi:hypothetical protein
MVAPIVPAPVPRHAISFEEALASLQATLGEPGARGRFGEPRWRVSGPPCGVWFELRDRAGSPVLMIEPDPGCTSEQRDVLFAELRRAEDIRLLLERALPRGERAGTR